MSLASLTLFCASLTLLGQVAAEPAAAPEALEKAVQEMGADDFKVRERAVDLLWRAGAAALPWLEKAASSDDLEVKFRARGLLDKVKFGITPQTRPELIALVDKFRAGNLAEKQETLTLLLRRKENRLVLALIRATKGDAEAERMASEFMTRELYKLLPELFKHGDFASAEQLLEAGAATEAGMPRLAGYLLARGKLTERIAALQAAQDKTPDAAGAALLAYCHQAAGDLPAARQAAEKSQNSRLRIALAMRAADWKEAAALMQASLGPRPATCNQLAPLAALHRLAGNTREFDAVLGQIKKLATENNAEAWMAAKALLLNEQVEDGLELLKKSYPRIAFELLIARSQYAQALELVHVPPDVKFTTEWFNGLPALEAEGVYGRFYFATRVLAQMRSLGRKEDHDQLQKLLEEIAGLQADPARFRLALAEAKIHAGLEKEGFADAEKFEPETRVKYLFYQAFPRHNQLAGFWWIQLNKLRPQDSPLVVYQQVWNILDVAARKVPPDAEWTALLERVAASLAELEPAQQGLGLAQLGETCELRGQRELALKYLRAAAVVWPGSGMELAKFLAKEEKWADAAAAYLQAHESDGSNVAALFLAGKCLEKSGQAAEAAKKLELANLLMCDPSTRWSVAYSLHQLDREADAAQQYALVARIGGDGPTTDNAAENLAHLVAKDQPAVAAINWEQVRVRLLFNDAMPSSVEALLALNRNIHKSKAKALLAAGKHDEAWNEIKQCEVVAPASVDTVEEFVAELRGGGRAAQADELYDRAYAVYAPLLKTYPDCPLLLNNTAWMSARSHRNLVEALRQATKAVEMAPKTSSYTDTLAEVYFQLGDRAKAVEWAKRSLELTPEMKLFAERLKEFETKPMPAP